MYRLPHVELVGILDSDDIYEGPLLMMRSSVCQAVLLESISTSHVTQRIDTAFPGEGFTD